MPSSLPRSVVLVHGWSVRSVATYGDLPGRLEQAARAALGVELDFEDIWLSKYVSFKDEVRLQDISTAFDVALATQLGKSLAAGGRFACITHSTGGPVVRDWLQRYYLDKGKADQCPMSHLIMLAPANFGSALAQLGKGRLSRIKAWFDGVEPGTGVLDWLELGSPESWKLNSNWIRSSQNRSPGTPWFPFVLTGQSIDRTLYDHVNSYTGEQASDGVVRVPSANLNASYLRLEQRLGGKARSPTSTFEVTGPISAPATAFAIVRGRSHSGPRRGILRSIASSDAGHPTVDAILRCLSVRTREDYAKLSADFHRETEDLVGDERVEIGADVVRPDHVELHDRHSMLIFRVRDNHDQIIEDFDFLLTAGETNDPNMLPSGFLTDRQRNRRDRGTVTYFLNHDVLTGCPEIRDPRDPGGYPLRRAVRGVDQLGIRVIPHLSDDRYFVRYAECQLAAGREQLKAVLKPHQTTLVDIVLQRIVGRGIFELTRDRTPGEFESTPGPPIGFDFLPDE